MNLRIFTALLCGYALSGCADIAKPTSRAERRLSDDFAGILGVPPAQVEVTDIVDKDNKITFTATTSKGIYTCAAVSPPFVALSYRTRNRTCTKIK
jgi:hypothetical protein